MEFLDHETWFGDQSYPEVEGEILHFNYHLTCYNICAANMQLDDQVPGLSHPEQPAIIDSSILIIDSSDEKDAQKSYSRRKRSAPRRYSPTPSWEKWENWEDCTALPNGDKTETAYQREVFNHISGGNNEETLRSRKDGSAKRSHEGIKTTYSKKTKSFPEKKNKKSLSPAPSNLTTTKNKGVPPARMDSKKPEFKLYSPATIYSAKTKDRSDFRSVTSANKTKDRFPTLAVSNPGKPKYKAPTPASTDSEKAKSTSPFPAAIESTRKKSTSSIPTAKDPVEAKSTSPTPAATDPKKLKYRPPTPAAAALKKRARGRPKKNTNSEQIEKLKTGSKRKWGCKKTPEVKEKRVYSKRTKRSAPKRYSPPYLPDRKTTLSFGDVAIKSRSRNPRTNAKISKSISLKWAHVLNRNPYVLLDRYVRSPCSLPLKNNVEFRSGGECGSEESESRCCTPTPSWMGEEEMASYYNSEMQLDIGRCSPTASSDDSPLTPDTDVLEYDRTSCSPVLNDVAIATTLDKDGEKSSPILSFNDTTIGTGATLEDDFDTCSPIPPLVVGSIFTSLEDEFDIGKCIPISLSNGPDKGSSSRTNNASHLPLGDVADTIPRSAVGKTTSVDESAVDRTNEIKLQMSCFPQYVSMMGMDMLSSAPLNDKISGSTEKELLSTVLPVKETSVGTTTDMCGPVSPLLEAAVILKDDRKSPILVKHAVAFGAKENSLSQLLSLRKASVGSTDNRSSPVPSPAEFTIRTTEKNRLNPMPSQGECVVGTAEKNESSRLPSMDKPAINASEINELNRAPVLNEAAVSTHEEKRLSQVPSEDEAVVSDTGEKTFSPVPPKVEAAVGSTDEKELGRVPSQGKAVVSASEEKRLIPVPCLAEVARVIAENGECDQVLSVDEAFNTVVNDRCDHTPSSDESVIPNCVQLIRCDTNIASTERIVLHGVSDEIKTDTKKRISSTCVQTVAMIDASVDTTELFPFPPLNTGIIAVVKTEKNGATSKECSSTSPLRDTAVDTSELGAKIPLGNISSDDAISTEKFTPFSPVTRRQRLISERSRCTPTTKSCASDSVSSIRYNPDVNKAFTLQGSYSSNIPYKPLKRETYGPKKDSLILIRRDYTNPESSSSSCFSSQDRNANRSWEEDDSRTESYNSPTRKSEEETVRLNPDLTADDVFDILFGPKKQSSDNTETPKFDRSQKRKRRHVDSETCCFSATSESSATSVGGSRALVSSFDNDSSIMAGTVLPRSRKRRHSSAVSLPERPSPSAASSTRSLKRRSLSNNLNDEPRRSTSPLSLNGYGCRTRKKRSAPKRCPTSSYLVETTNSYTENSFYFGREKKHYATRSSRSAPDRYSPTPFYDAYYYYDHKDQYSRKSLSETGNKLENGNNRKVRQMSVKSTSPDSLKVDDESHWEKFHGTNCTKQCASLTIIRDTPVPRDIDDKFRAQKTAPPEVSVADSKIPDAGNGAWASQVIPAQTRFGPYEGRIVPAEVLTTFAWLVIYISTLLLIVMFCYTSHS